MRPKSLIIAFIIFAILGAIPLLSFKDVKKINKRVEVTSIVQMEEIPEIKVIRSISKPAEVYLLYRF